MILEHSLRSARIIIVNQLQYELELVRSTMPSLIASKSIAVLQAHETNDKLKDFVGSFVYQVVLKNNTTDRFIANSVIALHLVNPMLTSIAFAVDFPSSLQLPRFGGEKGDYAQVVIGLQSNG